MMQRILIVEDKHTLSQMLAKSLTKEGFEIVIAPNVSEALRHLSTDKNLSLVLSDLKLPDGEGLAVLKASKERGIPLPFIMMTAFGSIDIAVKAVKEGAYDFITKPFDIDHLVRLIRDAISQQSTTYNRGGILTLRETGKIDMIGNSTAWLEVVHKAKKVANMKTTVLILGESGTGKELLAHFIHNQSQRCNEPFLAFNCSAIPKDLVENELFGHEKGAFTGAGELKPGRFEMAGSGTIFLDEIGDMDISLQAKILRVIQENEFVRIGGTRSIKVNARLIAASNKDLRQEVDKGLFRADLFYRLNVFPIHIPPLRERIEDVEPLAFYYLSLFSKEAAKHDVKLSDEALKILRSYNWPGNVRELRNAIERAVILCESSSTIGIELFDLQGATVKGSSHDNSLHGVSANAQRQAEIEKIKEALQKTGGNKTKAAELLKISYKTLFNKIRDYNI